MIIIKQYAVHKCGHEKEPVTGAECLRSMLGKENCSRSLTLINSPRLTILSDSNANLSLSNRSMTIIHYRYIIATQDRDLQNIVRNIPGVPLLYLSQQAPVLESPSPASQKRALEYRTLLGMNAGEAERIALLKKASGLALENDKPQLKKKRKKGGPNPLSCKKKKKTNVVNSIVKSNDEKNKHDDGKVGKRKRIKLPRHVKEILKSEISN